MGCEAGQCKTSTFVERLKWLKEMIEQFPSLPKIKHIANFTY